MPMIKNNLLDIEYLVEKIKLKKGHKVADLGCGAFGFFTFVLANRVAKEGKVYAVDIIKDGLDSIARKAKVDNLPQVETVWSDLEIFKATKIDDESLDSALLINVLHQSKNPEKILNEAKRMLKDGGLLLIVEWNELDSPFSFSTIKKISKEKIEKDATELDYAIEESFAAGKYHYGVVLRK